MILTIDRSTILCRCSRAKYFHRPPRRLTSPCRLRTCQANALFVYQHHHRSRLLLQRPSLTRVLKNSAKVSSWRGIIRIIQNHTMPLLGREVGLNVMAPFHMLSTALSTISEQGNEVQMLLRHALFFSWKVFYSMK